VMLPGPVFPRTCYCCSWCMYSCLCMVCEGLTLAGVCAGCHRGTSCAPVQPARRPWCASEGSRCGRSSTTFLLAPAAEISVRQWLSLGGCCVGPRSWTGAMRSMRSFAGCRKACPANSACPLGCGGTPQLDCTPCQQFRTSCASQRNMTTAPCLKIKRCTAFRMLFKIHMQ